MSVAAVILTARAEADIDRAVLDTLHKSPLSAGPWLQQLLATLNSLS
jgi:plasmid stabilization system protein ParE